MALIDGKQIRDVSVSLDKIKGFSGIVTFTQSATMSFDSGSVLRQADSNILVGTDVVNKNYVDAVAQGLHIKESVYVISNTASISLFGTSDIIDGHTLTIGDRVLVNAQSASASNGIYVVSSGSWSRALDSDGMPSNEVSEGDFVFIQHGNTYATTGWVLSTTDAVDHYNIQVGTESQKWTQFSSAGVISAGSGLVQNGSDFDVNTGIGLTISSDQVVIANTGVVSGAYGSADQVTTFTVNDQGQLTAAGTASINIVSTQISDFDQAAEAAVFETDNFVDGETIDFTVLGATGVGAEVTLGSLTASRFNIINAASASQGWQLGYNTSGQFEWFDPTLTGDITEVVAGNGLSGGGLTGVITLDVNVDNGLSIVGDNVVLGGTLSQNTVISGQSFDFTIGDVDVLLFTSSVFDVEADGFISLDAGTGSVQILADDTITISASSSLDFLTLGDLSFGFGTGNVSDNSGNGLGLVYTSDYSGTFVTNSLISKKYVDDAVALLGSGTIAGVTAGNGLSGGGTSAYVTLDVNLGVDSGLTFSGDDIIIDTNIAGNGLDFSSGVLTVNTSEIVTSLAGDGLIANGLAIDVQVDTTGLTVSGDTVRLNTTITGDRTFQDSVTIAGNLTVNGTASYVYTENLYVEDNIITLNATFSGTPFLNAGLEVIRGTENSASLIWDETTDLWSAGLSGSEVSILLNAGTGLSKNGSTVSLDFGSITGTGLTQNGSQISIDTSGFATALAGDGLSANGGTLSVNVGNGLEIVSDTVYLGGTLSQNTVVNLDSNYISFYHPDLELLVDPGNEASIYSTDVVENVKLTVTSSVVKLQNSNLNEFVFSNYNNSIGDGSVNNTIVIKDAQNSKGAVYDGDYTANFTTYSLVTKGYVDSVVAGVGATNGVTEIAPGVIGLGGSLTQNTTINVDNFDLSIENFDTLSLTGSVVDVQLDNGLFLIDAGGSGSIDLYGGDVTIFATGSVDIVSTEEFTVSTGTGSVTTSNLEGLVYTTDYSATFVNNSLITKKYVDDSVALLGSGTIAGVTAGSGLSGGGTSGYITLDVNTGLGLTISSDNVEMVWAGTSSGLTFSSNGVVANVDGSTIIVNNSGQLQVVAGSALPVYDQFTAVITSGDDINVTGVTLTSTPNDYSRIQVFVNGQLQRLGNGTSSNVDCYFGSVGNAKLLSDLSSGDQFYWNGLVAGFDLSTSDKIDIVYES